MGDDKTSMPMGSRERERELLVPVGAAGDDPADDSDRKPSSSASSSHHQSGREVLKITVVYNSLERLLHELIDLRRMMLFSTVLRLLLVIYGEWQDAHMEVRYTDIDYLVFSDAAAMVAAGRSPFERSTYRYSPLLAFLLVPNSTFHRSWGKLLFSAAGLLVVFLLEAILKPSNVPERRERRSKITGTVVLSTEKAHDLLVGLFIDLILKLRGVPENLRLWSVAAWLFNPFTFTIGTRGNCEPVVCVIILWIILCLMNGKVVQAAFWYGLVVHFRIYPIIYSLPLVLVLSKQNISPAGKPYLWQWSSSQTTSGQSSDTRAAKPSVSWTAPWVFLRGIITRDTVLFGFLSGCMFFLWTAIFFHLYGWDFLNEALLYHLTRTDPRHNFSIYFYHIYLHHQQGFSALEKLISFLPQLMVQFSLIWCFAGDLPFCLFVQTVAFVAFNKVVTAQYFVWFFCLLPLILPWSNMRLKWKGLICISVWMGSQLHWLMWGYLLEFKGLSVFIQLWLASLLFLVANTFVLLMVIKHHRYSPIFMPSAKSGIAHARKLE